MAHEGPTIVVLTTNQADAANRDLLGLVIDYGVSARDIRPLQAGEPIPVNSSEVRYDAFGQPQLSASALVNAARH